MKRVKNNILINAQTSVNNETINFDLSADWILNNSMQIRFNPIAVSNGEFNTPKIGVDKVFKDFSFSAITDFHHINFDISDSGQKTKTSKFSKSVKVLV